MRHENDSDRDIRPFLKRRVEEARAEKQEALARAKEAEAQEAAYMRALEAENRRLHGVVEQQPSGHSMEPSAVEHARADLFGQSTKAFLLEALGNGQNWALDDLKRLAEERKLYVPEGSSLGRQLHGALLGLKSGGRVQIVDRGVWCLKRETPSAATGGASE